MLQKAQFEDLPQILELQKLAYASKAKLVQDYSIQPLTQTLAAVQEEFALGVILKYVKLGKIIGSVRAKLVDGVVQVGKLMVHPQEQNQGIGSKLLLEIEKYYPGHPLELFTSALSEKNINLYLRHGYRESARKKLQPNLEMVYMRKCP